MAIVSCETELQCAATQAWSVLADFGHFLEWATAGAGSIRLEGEGIGMVRHLDIPGLGQMSERLDVRDGKAMLLAYSLTTPGAGGMARYQANVQVSAVGTGGCKLNWTGEFEPLPELAVAEVSAELESAYRAMSVGLQAYVSANP
jgi:carbon monoxide dehydrogenase subunit G